MKKIDVVYKEWASKVSEENLRFLYERLTQRLSSDYSEVFDFLSKVQDIDKYLSGAKSSSELFGMLDPLEGVLKRELERRHH